MRSSLPVRDVALSPDGEWAAVASEYVLQSLYNMRMLNVLVSLLSSL